MSLRGTLSSMPAGGRAWASIPALQVPNGTVKPYHITGSGTLVQPVDVLSDEGKAGPAVAPGRQDPVGRIGGATGDQRTPPVVPFPDQARICCESFRRGKLLCRKVVPQPSRTPKSGDPTRGRNSRPGQDRNPGCRTQPGSGDPNPIVHRPPPAAMARRWASIQSTINFLISGSSTCAQSNISILQSCSRPYPR